MQISIHRRICVVFVPYLWIFSLESDREVSMLIAPETTATALASSNPASAAIGSDADVSRSISPNHATLQLKPATSPAAQASAVTWTAWRPPLILQLIVSSLIAH